ncbi:MAG: hypothetical protein ABSF44_15490 [Candidatus Bathyarchaeia archaeon]|jgi:hypothetical protein
MKNDDWLILLAVVIFVLWFVGFFTIGGLIDFLIIVVIILVVLRLLRGRKL